MRKFPFLLLFSFSFLLNTGVKAQTGTFTIQDVMNKVKEFIPAYKFHHYNWPLAPDSSYGASVLAPEEIDVSVEFKKGRPVQITMKNMDLNDNPAHLSIVTEVLKMVNESYLEWFTKFYKSAKKERKYDVREEMRDGRTLMNVTYLPKTKDQAALYFF